MTPQIDATATAEHEAATPPLSKASQFLTLFLSYRLVLALLLVGLPMAGKGPVLLGSSDQTLYTITAQLYAGISLLTLLLFRTGPLNTHNTCHVAIFIDIIAITLMMHASGGVTTGLGILLAVSIALGSLSSGGRASVLFAALASLTILTESLYAHMLGMFPNTAYTQAGLLGTVFFALALLAHFLSRRIRESEYLARQRGIDVAKLTQLNQLVIEHMGTGVVVVGPRGKVLLSNQAARQLLCMAGDEQAGGLDRLIPALAKTLQRWQDGRILQPARFKAGKGCPTLQAQFKPLGSKGGQGTLIFLEDTSRITSQAQQMKLASLGRLTASIAHEIRNPLGAIGHAIQLLQESPALQGTDRRMADIVDKNSRRLNRVIENVLSLSRRQAAPEAIRLHDWLAEWAREIRNNLSLGEEQLVLRTTAAVGAVKADPTQLRQILTTLAENAQSHFQGSPEQLRLQLDLHPAAASTAPYIEIRDNGPGITEERQEQVFEPFFTTQTGGTGLGLYIARELSEANHMQLEYHDNPHGGACFRLILAPDMVTS